MKNCSTPFYAFAIILILFAQTAAASWTTSFQPSKSFIENKSQFDGRNTSSNTRSSSSARQVLFAADMGATQIYFSKTGLTYRFDKKERKAESESKEFFEKNYQEREKAEHAVTIATDIINMTWEGANKDAQVIASGVNPDYFSYANGLNNVNGYQKLIYKNLYPAVDVEYTFHPDGGIKYALHLHPGADISKIKLQYDANKVSIDANGNVHLKTLFGDITDHAPVTFYAANNSNIPSHFIKDGKVISFLLESFDNTKEIIIDPWTVTPTMPNSNKVWEIESDSAGNAYIYGGDSPFKLQKYNSSGALQWTYTNGWDSSTYWVGTLLTDPSGNCYVTAGSVAAIAKVNNSGAQVWTANGGPVDEYWSLTFNCDGTKLICGGTSLIINVGDGKIFNIDLSNGSVISSLTVAKAIPSFIFNDINEVRSICFSPNGNYYFHTLDTVGCLSSALAINYRLLTSYSYAYGSPNYGFTPQPQHVIKATGSYIYTMDGANLNRRDIATGAVINSVSIPGGAFATPLFVQGIAPKNNGIDIDSCGYVYVGSQSQIHKFDAALNLITSVSTPSAVYDVAVTTNGEVLACGQGFAGSFSMSACAIRSYTCVTTVPLTVTTTNSNNSCYGNCSATAAANATNGTGPYTYLWSPNGQTTATATGLCSGTYIVTVTDANSSSVVSTVTVTEPSQLSVSTTSQNASCGSCNDGSASVSASGGTGPYTYAWNTTPVQNSATATGLGVGCYSVTITDANGCSVSDTACIVSVLNVNTTYSNPNCFGNCTAVVSTTPSDGTPPYTYYWSPNGQTTATVSTLCAGSYTVTVTDANGNTITAPVTVTQPGQLIVSHTSQDGSCGSCSDGSATASASGGTGPYTYTWNSTPVQTGQTATGLTPGCYNVTVVDAHGCRANDTVCVGSPPLTISTNNTNPLCFGGCTGTADATPSSGTPPYTYLWSPSAQTTQSVSGLCQGNYTVTVTDADGNTAVSTVAITTPTPLTISVTTQDASCSTCPDGSAWASATGGIPSYTFEWYTTPQQFTDTIYNLLPGSYFVCANDSNNCKACTTIVIGSPTDINEIDFTGGALRIYPNPSGGTFIIASKQKIVSFVITDVIGQEIERREDINKESVVFSNKNLAGGVYFVRVTIGNKVILRKVIIE